MWTLALACAFFLLIHILVSGSNLKSQLVGALGLTAYHILFSLFSICGFAWMVSAFFSARSDVLNLYIWEAPLPLKIVAFVVNFVGFMVWIVGALSPSPTNLLSLKKMPDTPVYGIIRVSRHPVLAGIGLMSAAHLVANGNLASWIFFGTLTALCLSGAHSIDRKREAMMGEAYARIKRRTSILPFAAILDGRTPFNASELGLVRIMLASSLFALLVVLHELLFAKPAI
jgi:uncharacterized membrane protein